MKKLFVALLCAGLLVGCSSEDSYSVKVSNDSDVLVSNDKLSLTKQGYFEYLLDKYGSSEVVKEALLTIADKELTSKDEKSEIDKLVKEREEQYAKYADGDLATYAKQLGYDSKDDYINDSIIPDVKQELLRKKYINDNLKDLIKTYQIATFEKIVVDKESTALKIIKEATSKEKFDELMKKDDYKSNAEDSGVVTKNSSLDDNLKKKLKKLSEVTKDGVYSEAIKLSDNTYAVIYLYNTNHKDTDKIVTAITNDSDAKEGIEGKILKKYNFSVNDSKLKKAVKKLSSEYIEE